jgi:hypothetical protein
LVARSKTPKITTKSDSDAVSDGERRAEQRKLAISAPLCGDFGVFYPVVVAIRNVSGRVASICAN